MDKVTEKLIERMKTASPYVEAAIAHGKAILEELAGCIGELEGITCTGTQFWRDQGHATKQPKFYANHGTDEACPLHGKPEPGKRLRIYVGTDGHLIAQAKRAMALNTELRELERQQYNGHAKIRRAECCLVDFFAALAWAVDGEGNAKLSGKSFTSQW